MRFTLLHIFCNQVNYTSSIVPCTYLIKINTTINNILTLVYNTGSIMIITCKHIGIGERGGH